MGSGLGPRANRDEKDVRSRHPSRDGEALISTIERSSGDSSSWDIDNNSSLVGLISTIGDSSSWDDGTTYSRGGLISTIEHSIGGPSPPHQSQSDQIHKRRSETSRDLPKVQTDTILGEPLATSPTSPTLLNESGVDLDQEGSAESGGYRSSFAPSKRALERIAKSRAREAAHHAAVRRPGRSGGAIGGGKRIVHQGGWGESDDEWEDEDGESVDSDDDPVAPGRGQDPGVGTGRNFGKPSAPGTPYGSAADLNQPERGRPLSYSPWRPSLGSGHGVCFPRGALVSQYPFNPDPGTPRRSKPRLPSTRSQWS